MRGCGSWMLSSIFAQLPEGGISIIRLFEVAVPYCEHHVDEGRHRLLVS